MKPQTPESCLKLLVPELPTLQLFDAHCTALHTTVGSRVVVNRYFGDLLDGFVAISHRCEEMQVIGKAIEFTTARA